MTAEAKLKVLAGADATLQSFFGSNPFRWFHLQLPPGYVMRPSGATCATVQQLGTGFLHAQEARADLNRPRFQIVVRDPNADVVDRAAAAIINWLGTVCFTSDADFTSPPTTPRQFPNFVNDLRPGLDYQLKPPIPTQLIDFTIWNRGLI